MRLAGRRSRSGAINRRKTSPSNSSDELLGEVAAKRIYRVFHDVALGGVGLVG